jgi:hypothetical protein
MKKSVKMYRKSGLSVSWTFSYLDWGIHGRGEAQFVSPPHDLLECKQLYIDISHFYHAADKIAVPSQIDHDSSVRAEYLHMLILL